MRRLILWLNNLAKLRLIYNNKYETLSTNNTSSFKAGSWKIGKTSKGNKLSRSNRELTYLNGLEKSITLVARLPSRRGLSELVKEIPRWATSHVGISNQGETLNAQNTTTMLGNRESTKQTTGAEAPQGEANFEQESERTQTHGRQPMGPPLNV
uniref:Uncharacterized protein n=1 Tax=Cannabis sativa TaxID=3483 RepID=A0A803P5J7_CANSA